MPPHETKEPESQQNPASQDASARSPFAGCVIMILALLMLFGMIGFALWVPFKQADEIEKFTAATPSPVPAEDLAVNEAKVADLSTRLEKFQSELKDDTKTARVELSSGDLNLAIAAYKPGQELRGTFRIKEITKDALIIDINYRLNGRPRLAKEGEKGGITSDPRYLIGTLKAKPRLASKELALQVESIDTAGGTPVPEGFLHNFATLRIFESYLKDQTLGPAMAALTRAELEPGKLVLSRIPGETPPETVSDSEFRLGSSRMLTWLGICSSVFLALVGVMVFLSIRKQRRDAKSGQTSRGDGGA